MQAGACKHGQVLMKSILLTIALCMFAAAPAAAKSGDAELLYRSTKCAPACTIIKLHGNFVTTEVAGEHGDAVALHVTDLRGPLEKFSPAQDLRPFDDKSPEDPPPPMGGNGSVTETYDYLTATEWVTVTIVFFYENDELVDVQVYESRRPRHIEN